MLSKWKAALSLLLIGRSVPTAAAEQLFLKGQTHLHSDRSGDSHTSPSEVARFYAVHGYDFIVFTDHHAADPSLVAALVRGGVALMEIANMNGAESTAGDAAHLGAEALWDAVLSTGVDVWGVASDDAHHYADAARVRGRGAVASPGDLGFVMVRARRDPAAIRDALARGDFYSSTGLRLDDVRLEQGELAIDMPASVAGPVETTFIGQGGRPLARVPGRRPRYRLAAAPPGYVRALVRDVQGHRAWVQPVRVPRPVQQGHAADGAPRRR